MDNLLGAPARADYYDPQTFQVFVRVGQQLNEKAIARLATLGFIETEWKLHQPLPESYENAGSDDFVTQPIPSESEAHNEIESALPRENPPPILPSASLENETEKTRAKSTLVRQRTVARVKNPFVTTCLYDGTGHIFINQTPLDNFRADGSLNLQLRLNGFFRLDEIRLARSQLDIYIQVSQANRISMQLIKAIVKSIGRALAHHDPALIPILRRHSLAGYKPLDEKQPSRRGAERK